MHQTMTQIGKSYGVDPKTVGKILYELNIRDINHPEQKGFPFEQAVTHGIAKACTSRDGGTYYRYDIERIQVEFEAKLPEASPARPHIETRPANIDAVEKKLQQMLQTLNTVLDNGEMTLLHRLKGDIADILILVKG